MAQGRDAKSAILISDAHQDKENCEHRNPNTRSSGVVTFISVRESEKGGECNMRRGGGGGGKREKREKSLGMNQHRL